MTVEQTAATEPETVPALKFEATLPRALVHRAAVAEVFVTDSVQVAENAFEIAAQLPRSHSIGEYGQLYDFMLLIEVLRQSGMVVAHRHLDISLDNMFIFTSLRFRARALDRIRVGPAPAHVVIAQQVAPNRNRAGRVLGFEFSDVEVRIDGVPALDVSGGLAFVSKRAYQALRGRTREEKLRAFGPVPGQLMPARPDVVGRRDARNVCITEPVPVSGGKVSATLVVDQAHPHLFDHPLDHIPGNLLLEGCRQAAVGGVTAWHGFAPSRSSIVGASAEFGDFAELDLNTRIVADIGEPVFDETMGATVIPVRAEVTQSGTSVASVKLEVATW